MVIEIITMVIIGLLVIHYIYTNWQKFILLRRSLEPRMAPLPTVTAVEVRVVPDNTQVIVVSEEI